MPDPSAIDVETSTLAAALAHAARVQILRLLLRRGPMTTTAIVAELPQAQSTVSEHLRILRRAGLVTPRRHGRTTRYEPEPLVLRRLSSLLASAAMTAPPAARS